MPERNSTAGLLAGRKMLVTDTVRGLGLVFTKSVAEVGGTVALVDILGERVQEEVAALCAAGFDARGFMLDLGDPALIQAYAVAAAQALDGPDGLVNNAAITDLDGCDAPSIDTETWNCVMNVNVRGTWLMTMACLPALKTSDRDIIVNLSSDTSPWDAPNPLTYVASKSVVTGMTKSLAHKCGADDIIVNAIAPGLALMEATEYVSVHRRALYRNRRAISRDRLPDDVCGVVLFMLSDLSRFVAGQTLAVNGGFVVQQCIHTPLRRGIQ